MISVSEALAMVLEHAVPRPAATVKVADALGLVLAEHVVSDIDSPPHDKAMVDGYAVVSSDLASGIARLKILEEVTAGAVPHRAVTPGAATRIMTGAPVPEGADAVVMVEKTSLVDDSLVEITQTGVSGGLNIMPRGTSLERGEVVLTKGREIRPLEVGLLSEVGRAKVQVIRRPRVAVLATGDELVSVSTNLPTAGKIRNSNGPMLAAAASRIGATVVDLGIARDEKIELARMINNALESDVVMLSGGVSAGVLDLVPATLEELGAVEVFHHVWLKPGKPLWFGIKPAEPRDVLIFGLPGNPAGALVCFELFVWPALNKMAGHEPSVPISMPAQLAVPWHHRGKRPTYHPARFSSQGALVVEPIDWHGSADLAGLARANVLVLFSKEDHMYAAGDVVEIFPL